MEHDRTDPHALAPDLYKAILGIEKYVRQQVDSRLLHLVKLRASMVNGCAFCVDMHSTEAIADGESTARLFAVSVWREAPLFSDAEDVVLAESLSTEFLVLLEALAPRSGQRSSSTTSSATRTWRWPRRSAAAKGPRASCSAGPASTSPATSTASTSTSSAGDLLVHRFRAACERGDLDAFLAVLTEDATLVSDGGAEVKAPPPGDRRRAGGPVPQQGAGARARPLRAPRRGAQRRPGPRIVAGVGPTARARRG